MTTPRRPRRPRAASADEQAPGARVQHAQAPGAALVRADPLPPSFYDRDPRLVARDLLGATLEVHAADGVASGRIVETEAYLGSDDPGCHAVAGRTRRTWHLFGPPGLAYVYRIYGMYWCLNAVTLGEGTGSAVLLRAVEPVTGIALMRQRRPRAADDRELTNGPSKLCAAFGVDGALDGAPLQTPPLLLRPGPAVRDADVLVTPRIGLTRGAELPYRYLVRDSRFVSRTPRAFPSAEYAGPA